MLELLFCATFTLLPDYLYRRFRQGKRIGHEITLFSVWYELRIGLTTCLMLTIALITVVFYYHPSSTNVTSFFRTVSILPEGSGRVKEIFIATNDEVKQGDLLFTLDDRTQRAAVDSAEKRVAEVEAEFDTAEAELAAAQGAVDQAQGALTQAEEELEIRAQLLAEGSPATSPREVERLENTVDSRLGAYETAQAQYKAVETKLTRSLPAKLETAKAQLEEANTALSKMEVYAGVNGVVQQFGLQVGDIVNPFMRPAGLLVPPAVGDGIFQAGFNQLNAQVIKLGMIGEMTCLSQPFFIVPVRVSALPPVVATGQFRPSDQLLDVQDRARPGTLLVQVEEVFEGSTDRIAPGSKCILNLYTDNHERLATEEFGFWHGLYLHMVDTVGLVHALILRIQALMLPVNGLVLTGGH
ncbi:multidrug resistance efflux pump [Aliiruegeria haliotis]|uniref:Multidrug resistance efflux pump n=1 Tax=Aliiruegeria haliotis TaxID=1280846 RepID=A0A2T0RY16_9RHOB|nr:biotin/lipoyl-binding protein [Aliiruegeria haliotis]PRY26079.1 multidrug resistance efflux pump [Aliiruegeria haliotis]